MSYESCIRVTDWRTLEWAKPNWQEDEFSKLG
jgi:hypothetical protein